MVFFSFIFLLQMVQAIQVLRFHLLELEKVKTRLLPTAFFFFLMAFPLLSWPPLPARVASDEMLLCCAREREEVCV